MKDNMEAGAEAEAGVHAESDSETKAEEMTV